MSLWITFVFPKMINHYQPEMSNRSWQQDVKVSFFLAYPVHLSQHPKMSKSSLRFRSPKTQLSEVLYFPLNPSPLNQNPKL